MDRHVELLELAAAGDEDAALLVESELFLAPTPAQIMFDRLRSLEAAAEEYAPVQEKPDEAAIAELAEEAGF